MSNICNEKGKIGGLKKDLANEIDEITLLWMCSQKNREIAFDNNVNKWTHIDCNSDNLGITGQVKKKVLDQILTVNKSNDLLILPEKINNTYMDWHLSKPLEFFIDFETMTSIFSPLKVGDNYEHSGHNMEQYIFMIGLGYIHQEQKNGCIKILQLIKFLMMKNKRLLIICGIILIIYVINIIKNFQIFIIGVMLNQYVIQKQIKDIIIDGMI